MDEKLTMGQLIRRQRKKLGITMKELGSRVGLSEQAISQYELDKRTPSDSVLIQLATELKISSFELLVASGKDTKQIKLFYNSIAKTYNSEEVRNYSKDLIDTIDIVDNEIAIKKNAVDAIFSIAEYAGMSNDLSHISKEEFFELLDEVCATFKFELKKIYRNKGLSSDKNKEGD